MQMMKTVSTVKQRGKAALLLLLLLSLIHSQIWAGGLVTAEIAQQLLNIQLRSEEDAITVVLELDGTAPQFSVVALQTPERIVVDLPGLKNAREAGTDYNQLLTPQMHRTGLERLQVARAGDGLRITFFTSRKLRYALDRDKNAIILNLVPEDIASQKSPVGPAPKGSAETSQTMPANENRALTQAWKQSGKIESWSAKAPITESVSSRAGRKSFATGLKYEEKQQWDLAFQNFTVAMTAEPNNPEYRLHAQRAAQNAAILLTQQGDGLANQGDFAGALRAYQRAVSIDATNEQARTKLQQTRALVQGAGNSADSGNSQISVSSNPKNNQTVYFNNANLRQVIEVMANNLGLNVMFDESFRDEPKFRLKLENVSLGKALDQILLQTKHTFERTDHRTILIYQDNPQNRQRFEQLMFKTFYLSNADLNEARTLVQSVIGQQRQVLVVKNLNALVVRDTPANLQIVQELLDSIDKNRAEVLVDVDIYEVTRSTSLAIGNQLATAPLSVTTNVGVDRNGNPVTNTVNSGSLGNLGGIGLAGITAIAGQTATAGLGTIIGLPPSTLSLLKSKSNSKLLASTQIHALDGEQNQTKVGRSVPVRIGSTFVPGFSTPTGATGTTTTSTLGSGSFDSIQYRDVGLIIDVTPTVNNEGWVQIKMKLESSSVESAAAGTNLTPSFSQRALTTIARVMDGRTAIVAGVKQETKGDSRSGIPVIGMVPILGRLFSTPQEESSLSDIVITVTPHVVRATTIRPQDYRARTGGSMLSGVAASVDDLLRRVEEEERQNRSLTQNNSSFVATASGNNVPPRREAEPVVNPVPATDPNAANPGSVVSLSLTPSIVVAAVNESMYLAVTISGSVQISEAVVSLGYDPSVLQLKSIQNGALLGKQAVMTPQGDNGKISLQVQQGANHAPVSAECQLLILEFDGLKAGKTAVSFINGEQAIKLGQPLPAQFQLLGAEIEVK